MLAIFSLLSALALAFAFSEACRKLKVPRVVGQVLAGVVLGNTFLRPLLFPHEFAPLFQFFSDVGLVLLFFFVGLGISVRDFSKHFKTSALVSFFNTALPLTAGVLILSSLGYGLQTAVIVGIALAVSSQAVAIDFLQEFGMLKTRLGKLIVTVGAVDDVFELLLIAIVMAFINSAAGAVGILALLLRVAAFLAVAYLFQKAVVPYLLKLFEEEDSKAGLFTGAVVAALSFAALADFLGIGGVVGALLAGIIVRHALLTSSLHHPWEEHELSWLLHTVSFGLFVPLFFVYVGVQTDLANIYANLGFGLLLTVIALAGTLAGTMLGVRLAGGSASEGYAAGWALNAKGDTELVIGSVALASGAITTGIFSAIVFMALATTIISPVVFRAICRGSKGRSTE